MFGRPTMSREQLYRSPVVTYMAKLQQPTQVAMGRLGSVAHHLHNQLECFVTSQHHWKSGEFEPSTEFDASILYSLPQHTPLGVFSQPSQIVPGKLYTTRPRPRHSVLHREDGYFVSIPRQPYSGDKDQFTYFDPIHFQESEFEQFAAARLNTQMAKRLFSQHTRAPLLFACNARYEEQGQIKHCSQPDLAVNIRYCTRCDTTLCSHRHSDPGNCSQHAASGDFVGPAQIVGYVGIIMSNFLQLLRALEAQKNDLVVHYRLMTKEQFFAVLDQVQYNFVNFMDAYFQLDSETIITNGLRWEPISIKQSRDSLSHVCKDNVQNPKYFLDPEKLQTWKTLAEGAMAQIDPAGGYVPTLAPTAVEQQTFDDGYSQMLRRIQHLFLLSTQQVTEERHVFPSPTLFSDGRFAKVELKLDLATPVVDFRPAPTKLNNQHPNWPIAPGVSSFASRSSTTKGQKDSQSLQLTIDNPMVATELTKKWADTLISMPMPTDPTPPLQFDPTDPTPPLDSSPGSDVVHDHSYNQPSDFTASGESKFLPEPVQQPSGRRSVFAEGRLSSPIDRNRGVILEATNSEPELSLAQANSPSPSMRARKRRRTKADYRLKLQGDKGLTLKFVKKTVKSDLLKKVSASRSSFFQL